MTYREPAPLRRAVVTLVASADELGAPSINRLTTRPPPATTSHRSGSRCPQPSRSMGGDRFVSCGRLFLAPSAPQRTKPNLPITSKTPATAIRIRPPPIKRDRVGDACLAESVECRGWERLMRAWRRCRPAPFNRCNQRYREPTAVDGPSSSLSHPRHPAQTPVLLRPAMLPRRRAVRFEASKSPDQNPAFPYRC